MAIQIATRASVKLIKTGDGAKNPGGIHGRSKRLEFLGERRVAESGLFYFGRELEEIGEQSVEDVDLILE